MLKKKKKRIYLHGQNAKGFLGIAIMAPAG